MLKEWPNFLVNSIIIKTLTRSSIYSYSFTLKVYQHVPAKCFTFKEIHGGDLRQMHNPDDYDQVAELDGNFQN